ncbi:hypothetical protein EVAR_84069_1 [Eumeta japonica]|uniref:Secreted protein n=1 Tax=Eumeta variegata TaxID=151549 RepID=A0A4C1V0Q5_EUMVA|nr:hypothetical protein EVAR_84069_1 [Eumeta japonica]
MFLMTLITLMRVTTPFVALSPFNAAHLFLPRTHFRSQAVQCSFEPRSVVSGSARTSVGAAQCGAAAVKPRASVPARSSGYPAVCAEPARGFCA